MRIAIINRYYPPYQGITGYYAELMAQHVSQLQDVEIHVYCQKGDYTNKDTFMPTNEPVGILHYQGNAKRPTGTLMRLFDSIWSTWRLLSDVRKGNFDYYIVMTDPPFLPLLASMILPADRVVLWTMDLYPQAFVANGLLSEHSIIYKKYLKKITKNSPGIIITLGDAQSQYLKNYYSTKNYFTIPIGIIADNLITDTATPFWYEEDKIHLGYIGNIGEAHNARLILDLADALDPQHHRLILACYGRKSSSVILELRDNPNISIIDYLPMNEMKYIDIQIVSLLPHWTHISVPSKAISAIQQGSAVLYCGNKDSDTWSYVKDAAFHLPPDYTREKLVSLLGKINTQSLHDKRQGTQKAWQAISNLFNQGMNNFLNILSSPD